MRRHWKTALYSTELVSDHEEGWIALQLHRQAGGQCSVVARIVFWDAEGQFVLETSNNELPLDIVEEFINEARTMIKIE